jgi:medium-chain acyl-[acyl-carrier-protein] hydrolase
MDRVYVKEFELHAYETDSAGKAQPLALLNYLQDTAGEHAGRLGFGFNDLTPKGLLWVLSRYHVRVQAYPDWGGRIRVATWPSDHHGIFALRDFEMTDADGRPLAQATSSWIMLDVRTKQPVRVEDHIAGRVILEKRAVDDPFDPLPGLDGTDGEREFSVLYKDLDLNRHVNHAVYIQWALETVPPEVLKTKRPAEIEVAYKAEAFYGDRAVSKRKAEKTGDRPSYRHGLFKVEGGPELARLRTVWD